MPRRTRAQGRPGTKIFPAAWNESHAVVVGKSFTARCRIHVQPDYENPGNGEPIYDSGCRVQVLNSAEATALVGDQRQVTAGYLVVVDYTADIPISALVEVYGCTDPSLKGSRRLVVSKVARGTQRWERDLWCVDDMTRQEA